MLSRALFEFIDDLLQDLRGNSLRFGGITLVMSGDFLQSLVVVPSERRDEEEEGNELWVDVDIVDELPFKSKLWEHVRVLRMTDQVRQRSDPQFGSMVLGVAKGH